jgi:hypothetical protein
VASLCGALPSSDAPTVRQRTGALGSPRGKPVNAEFAAAKAGLRMISRSIAPELMSSIGEWLFCSTDEGESKCPSPKSPPWYDFYGTLAPVLAAQFFSCRRLRTSTLPASEREAGHSATGA